MILALSVLVGIFLCLGAWLALLPGHASGPKQAHSVRGTPDLEALRRNKELEQEHLVSNAKTEFRREVQHGLEHPPVKESPRFLSPFKAATRKPNAP